MEEQDYEVVPNTKGKSDIWKHFGVKKRRLDGFIEEGIAVCFTCKSTLRTGGGTSNILAHVRRHHPTFLCKSTTVVSKQLPPQPATASHFNTQPEEEHQQKRPKHTFGAFQVRHKYPPNSPRAEEITHKIARFLVTDLRPYSLVDSDHWTSLLASLDSKYQCPRSTQFSESVIPKLYTDLKSKVLADIQEAEQVTLTIDGWTSRASDSYITITAVYMSVSDWKIKNYVLQTWHMSESHTAENITKVIQDTIAEWKLPMSLGLTLVSDNAANMLRAGKLLDCHLHISCFAHTLNLAVQKALKVNGTAEILNRIRRIVTFFHSSPMASNRLKEKSALLHLQAGKLKIDVCSRWNSTYDMLSRFRHLQPAVDVVIRSKEVIGLKEHDLASLSDEENLAVEELEVFLRPLKDMTTYMCSEEMLTSSIIMPLFESLVSSNGHLRPKDTDSRLVKQMKAIMKENLQGSYFDQKEMLHATSALDPRFKGLPNLPAEEREKTFNKLANIALRFHSRQEPTQTTSVSPSPSAVQDIPVVRQVHRKLPCTTSTWQEEDRKSQIKNESTCLLDSLLKDVYTLDTSHAAPSRLCNEEIIRYREERGIGINHCPLQWWRTNEHRFPTLARVAKAYLTIPATSVSAERVFSTAGDIMTAQRTSLKPQHVDIMLFLKGNL